jgi:hypothetical protein
MLERPGNQRSASEESEQFGTARVEAGGRSATEQDPRAYERT